MLLKNNDVVLFQGDSITDTGRARDNAEANALLALGSGYALFAGVSLLGQQASLGLSIYNRGVSGDVVGQLASRWQSDCLDLKPNVLSVLVGINDTARPLANHPDGDTPEGYEQTYRKILDDAKQQNPDLRMVICEPFALVTGNVTNDWLPGLGARQAIARQIATDYDAVWVPFQQLFDDAVKDAPAQYWLPDGVHPTLGGHHRMAQMWLEKVGATTCCSKAG